MVMRGIHLYSLLAVCLLYASCSADGDKHPHVKTLHEAFEEHPDFVIEQLYVGQSILDIEVVGEQLVVTSLPRLKPGDTLASGRRDMSLEVWRKGEPCLYYNLPHNWSRYDMVRSADNHIYQGPYCFAPPEYDSFTILPIITRDSVAGSVKVLQTALKGIDTSLTVADLRDVYGDDYPVEKTDSLTGRLFANYAGDRTAQDTSYRRHLYHFLKHAHWYIQDQGFTLVHMGDVTYYWMSGREPTGADRMLTQFNDFGAHWRNDNSTLIGPQFFSDNISHETPKLSVTRFDKALEEWKMDGFGAPHVGGILWFNPEYIWYYQVKIDGQEVLQFKVYENTSEEDLVSLGYYALKPEFYLVNTSGTGIERIKYLPAQ